MTTAGIMIGVEDRQTTIPVPCLCAWVTSAPPVILDPGETELLALAQSLADPLVLLDDEVARTEARRLKLRLCGTLGILVRAYGQN